MDLQELFQRYLLEEWDRFGSTQSWSQIFVNTFAFEKQNIQCILEMYEEINTQRHLSCVRGKQTQSTQALFDLLETFLVAQHWPQDIWEEEQARLTDLLKRVVEGYKTNKRMYKQIRHYHRTHELPSERSGVFAALDWLTPDLEASAKDRDYVQELNGLMQQDSHWWHSQTFYRLFHALDTQKQPFQNIHKRFDARQSRTFFHLCMAEEFFLSMLCNTPAFAVHTHSSSSSVLEARASANSSSAVAQSSVLEVLAWTPELNQWLADALGKDVFCLSRVCKSLSQMKWRTLHMQSRHVPNLFERFPTLRSSVRRLVLAVDPTTTLPLMHAHALKHLELLGMETHSQLQVCLPPDRLISLSLSSFPEYVPWLDTQTTIRTCTLSDFIWDSERVYTLRTLLCKWTQLESFELISRSKYKVSLLVPFPLVFSQPLRALSFEAPAMYALHLKDTSMLHSLALHTAGLEILEGPTEFPELTQLSLCILSLRVVSQCLEWKCPKLNHLTLSVFSIPQCILPVHWGSLSSVTIVCLDKQETSSVEFPPFPNLHTLWTHHVHTVVVSSRLPALQHIILKGCASFQIKDEEEDQSPLFPSLRELSLEDSISLPWRRFSHVQRLSISHGTKDVELPSTFWEDTKHIPEIVLEGNALLMPSSQPKLPDDTRTTKLVLNFCKPVPIVSAPSTTRVLCVSFLRNGN